MYLSIHLRSYQNQRIHKYLALWYHKGYIFLQNIQLLMYAVMKSSLLKVFAVDISDPNLAQQNIVIRCKIQNGSNGQAEGPTGRSICDDRYRRSSTIWANILDHCSTGPALNTRSTVLPDRMRALCD
ncbi:hypothetical protein VTP01DRAFT_7224 [Rhizomucor pusillus]|uniref:uncharacterized protein n=1 Tax=Rhizomucor pusillus TaxID=4840 RepID=UPI0037432265